MCVCIHYIPPSSSLLPPPPPPPRSAGIQVGQALVDTKRLKIVSTTDSEFKDEINQFLDLGEAAILSVECGNSPVVKDAPKWFQHLPQESDSEYESTGDKQTDMT